MIKLIIFDVGGVIDTFDEKYYIRYICRKLKIDQKEFKEALIPLLDKMEVSKISLDEMLYRLSQRFNISKEKLEWGSAFSKLNCVNTNVVKLMARLSKHYNIAILTNVSRSRHEMKMGRYLEKVKYDRIFASCYLKMNKPHAKIYRFVLKKMKVKANEAIFIDNLERNVAGARKVGIKSIQFKGYAQLAHSLKKIGIE